MSEHYKIGLVTTVMSHQDALQCLEDALHLLIEQYEFGLRGYGCVSEIEVGGHRHGCQGALIPGYQNLSALEPTGLETLASRNPYFTIDGSIRLRGELRLYDVMLALCPSGVEDNPAIFAVEFPGSFHEDLYAEDPDVPDRMVVRPDEAELFEQLVMALGGHPRADGFTTMIMQHIGEVKAFDAKQLVSALFNPPRVQASWDDRSLLRAGLVTGIRKELVDEGAVRARWAEVKQFETTAGHVVRSGIVDDPLDLFLDELDDE
ncbi:hypothetical protein PPSIR1_22194 [Plesiocystis pacifica SIR-1]|uniref:Uncharacterized protein n=1 Tax=Plesiocystis pacifica SIR-1 TaxID=391625 RepID=A6FXT6_9BACT|nr:hypothetical protein [Plesiocystis pacifica]EDM81674.1 hypothetical protein PPSIR1_22194 [Plesiocystis pacifica SIR-1]